MTKKDKQTLAWLEKLLKEYKAKFIETQLRIHNLRSQKKP